jgi:precorrin-6B methylase 2
MNDPFGEAIKDYFEKGKAPIIKVNSNYTEDEEIQPSYFFRTEKEMPAIEQKALKLCKGSVLDVGAAAGCHSLFLQKKGFNITAIEKSELASEILTKRGIQRVVNKDIYDFNACCFDTILLLMNGAGIGETLKGLEKLLQHLKTLLSPSGQILIDSTDISYLFEEADGSVWMDMANPEYYGEMTYNVEYKKTIAEFKWLFVDDDRLKKASENTGLNFSLISKGKHFDYLARLTK